MNSTNYLYGLSVQGIQSYIFNSNKLSEIIGGSEVIELCCTKWFADFKKEHHLNGTLISAAAGKIRYVTSNRAEVELIYQEYAEVMRSKAAGLPYSQAVVEVGDAINKAALNKLRIALDAQRNCPPYSGDARTMARERAPRTGGAAVREHKWKTSNNAEDKEFIDALTDAKESTIRDTRTNALKTTTGLGEKVKVDTMKEGNYTYPTEFAELAKGNGKSWLAVIHVDGNGVGKLINELLDAEGDQTEKLQRFSTALEEATKVAFEKAVETTLFTQKVLETCEGNIVPIRPLILGGDDLQVIVRGDLAIAFTKAYLSAFEIETRTNEQLHEFCPNGITACAGIAFVKEKFPFHYSAHLAEQLCGWSKDKTNREVSAFQFHMVRDSFIEKYKDIIEREYKYGNNYFEYGPFVTTPNSVVKGVAADTLTDDLNLLADKRAPVNGIRQWLSTVFTDAAMAAELKRRMVNQDTDNIFSTLLDDSNENRLLLTLAAHAVGNHK